MPPEQDDRYSLRSLTTPASLARLAVIGGIVVLTLAAFVWAGGFFSPHRLNQARIVHAFKEADGNHPGFRRNHEKGICFSGWFQGNGAGALFSRANSFRPGRIPVFGRFSIAGGMSPDGPKGLHSMAINFALRDGGVWRTAMVPLPVFPVSNVRAFYDMLLTSIPIRKRENPIRRN